MDETITWRLHLSSPPERVFEALTTDAGRAAFWAESAVERDGAIHFEFIGGVTPPPCPIRECTPPHRFALTYFGHDVSFDLTPDGEGGTDLELNTSGFLPEERDDVLPGWLNVLLPLKAYVDFGIDLRNHDPRRTWRERYVDQ